MYGEKNRLSLTQHFAVAALSMTLGMAAAVAANAAIVPVLDAIYYTPVTAFAVNFSALFAVTGGTAGYTEQAFAQYNRAHPKLQPWALPAQDWWHKKGGP
jgi:hypothetical protein